MLVNETKRLLDFTNARGIVAGLAMLHVDEKGRAWANDSEIELFLPKTALPHSMRWSVNADQLAKLLNAAGKDASVALDGDEVVVTAGAFTAKTKRGADENHLTPLYKDLSPKSKKCVVHKLNKPKAFTEALRCVSAFAATDAAGGVHWVAVLLRGQSMFASNQGFSVCGVTIEDETPVSDGDVLIPARACALVGSDATITELILNQEAGLGAFRLKDGGMIVFRMIEPPEKGYPDAGALLERAPESDKVWTTIDDNFTLGVAQALSVVDPKEPLVGLHNDDGWYLYSKGFGEVNVELSEFDCEGDSVRLNETYWNSILNVASELASVGNMLWFRSEFELDDKGGTFSLVGIVNGQTADEEAEDEEEAAEQGEAEDY